MREIPLTKGAFAIVDEDDYDWLNQWEWHLNDSGYAVRRGIIDGKKQTVRMHRLVNNTPEGSVTDHINHNRLDNRRFNLRTCTQGENASFVKRRRGYCWDSSKSKWMVRMGNKFCGRYATEQEAIEAVQKYRSGQEYTPKRRKLYFLPKGVSKQFGRYRVRPGTNGVRVWLGSYATISEAEKALKEWQERQGISSQGQ